jgi:hypothetical protein
MKLKYKLIIELNEFRFENGEMYNFPDISKKSKFIMNTFIYFSHN